MAPVTIDAGGLITQGAAIGGDNDSVSVAITSTGGSLDSNNTIDAQTSVAITTGQNVDLLSAGHRWYFDRDRRWWHGGCRFAVERWYERRRFR